MPQINLFSDQIGKNVPQTNPGGASGFSTEGTDAIRQLADIGSGIASQVVANDRALKVSSLSTQAAMEIENYVFDLQKTDRDYSTQFDRYQDFTNDLMDRYGKELEGDNAGYSTFRSNVGQIAFRKGFDVRSHAINGQMDVQKAQLTLNMAALSELAVQGDDEQREMVKTKAQILLNESYDNGVVDANEAANLGLKFQDDVVSAQVRYDILVDPDQSVTKLLKGEYSGLSNEQQMIWLEKANSASEARARKAIAEEDRARREADRLEKEAADNMAKAGDELLYTGQLSTDWIEQNKEILDPADYRFYYKAIATGSEASTNVRIYSSLRERASNGEDVRAEARERLRQGTLKVSDYNTLVNRSEQNIGVVDIPNWFKRGEQYLGSAFRVSDVNPDPAAPQRYADVMDEWNQWATENPNPTLEQARSAYQQIAKDYTLIDTSQMTLTKRMPSFAVGNRNTMDIEATINATVEAFESGVINEEQFNKQALLIQEWERAMQQRAGGSNARDQ